MNPLGGGGTDSGDFNPFDPGTKLLHDVGVSESGINAVNQIADPLDLFGRRAGQTRQSITDILTSSAQAGIDEQTRMQDIMDKLFQPYYETGLQSFGDLNKLSTGGGMPEGYQPSKLYQLQLEQGNKAINAQQNKAGLLHSSATEQRKSDLSAGLAAEEAQRVYGGALSSVKLGTNAADAIDSASRSLGGNVGSLYSNLGSSLNANLQAYGQARANSMQSLSNIFSGAATAYGSGS